MASGGYASEAHRKALQGAGALPGTAITQTYSTASSTIAAMTAGAPAVTVGAALGAFTDPPSAAEMSALRTFVNALKTDNAATLVELAKLVTDVTNDKKNLNQTTDDLQAYGIQS
jgi:hypothetical protein